MGPVGMTTDLRTVLRTLLKNRALTLGDRAPKRAPSPIYASYAHGVRTLPANRAQGVCAQTSGEAGGAGRGSLDTAQVGLGVTPQQPHGKANCVAPTLRGGVRYALGGIEEQEGEPPCR